MTTVDRDLDAGAATDRRAAAPEARFEVVSRSTLPEEIANRLLEQIRAQQLRPGDKLPAERNLARMMEVSRPVLREALRALALMRVVDIRQGDGTYITSLEPKQLISHLDFVFSKDSVALVQLLEARRVIEAGNVRLAAARVTDDEIAGLEMRLDAMAACIDDPERFSELDIAMHMAVCDAAENFLLLQFMNIISALGRVSRERTGGLKTVREAALEDHRRIVEGLRHHDADAAEAAMRRHLDHVDAGLRAVLGADETPAAVLGTRAP
ncbi:MAG: FadR family transcriptional regulator [Chloroflexi bacterium]|nr:FadR family transcriptional regulator [Chloroflexota bacterium]